MAVKSQAEIKAGLVRKVKAALNSYMDAAVKDAEKAAFKEVIEKAMKQLPEYDVDWEKGQLVNKRSKPSGNNAAQQPKQEAKQQPKQEQPKTKKADDGQWTTADLVDYLNKKYGKSMTAKQLRIHLRKMEMYNDGRMTHYRWSGPNDAMVKAVEEFIFGKKATATA